ncbi:MAG: aminotransferase class, partial [Modestobacter sp.]|nr:aminotransferase class [Modestobacter sp.]
MPAMREVPLGITAVTGRPVSYHAETVEETYASYGSPDWQVDAWVSTCRAPPPGRRPRCSPPEAARQDDGVTRAPYLSARLQGFGTTVFAEMSALAVATGSINLGQGFPDE